MRLGAKLCVLTVLCALLTGCNTTLPQSPSTNNGVTTTLAPAQDSNVPAPAVKNTTSSASVVDNSTSASSNPSSSDSSGQQNPTGNSTSSGYVESKASSQNQHRSIILSEGSQGPEVLKLEQLLSETGYLPLTFVPAPKNTSSSGQTPTLVGTWQWKYTSTPESLKALWSPGKYTVLTKSAVMSLEQAHHLAVDGIAGPKVFKALLSDVSAHRHSPYGFTYVLVSLKVPQSLSLWHDGKIVLKSRANGGIPQSPTVKGTYPVYLQYRSQTMSGTNPDGTHYSDKGVPYVSYFYGGEAVHGFVRQHYGSPQSLGCVELPVKTASRVWPYMHLGTLVHIA